MNPRILQIINRVLKTQKTAYSKAGDLAKEFGMKDGDIMADIMSTNPDVLTHLPDMETITVGKLRQIALMLIVHYESKTPEVQKALDYAIAAHAHLVENDHKAQHPILRLRIFDYHIMDTLKYLTDRDEIERPCLRCPVRKKV